MLLSLVYINCDYLQAQTTIPRFEEGERVVFVGNSITHGGHYHSFIWLYYMTRFPDKPITIMNAGIGGESAWDMKDRLDYDVFNRKPTYVTLTFGMNDTGYDIYMKDDAKELSEQRIAKSLESYREIEERLLAKNKITTRYRALSVRPRAGHVRPLQQPQIYFIPHSANIPAPPLLHCSHGGERHGQNGGRLAALCADRQHLRLSDVQKSTKHSTGGRICRWQQRALCCGRSRWARQTGS